MTLKDIYLDLIKDDNKSLLYKTVHRYAKKVRHITEFGTGKGLVTSAILWGQGKYTKLISYDLVGTKEVKELKDVAKTERKYFSYLWWDTTQLIIDKTDMLIIDTKHNANHLWAELYDNAPMVDKYIIICGTEEFGEFGEDEWHLWLGASIKKFVDESWKWKVKIKDSNWYWFTILERKWIIEKTCQ